MSRQGSQDGAPGTVPTAGATLPAPTSAPAPADPVPWWRLSELRWAAAWEVGRRS